MIQWPALDPQLAAALLSLICIIIPLQKVLILLIFILVFEAFDLNGVDFFRLSRVRDGLWIDLKYR